jgi:hypothetical protein
MHAGDATQCGSAGGRGGDVGPTSLSGGVMLHALQVNLRGGRLPEPEDNGKRYLKFPIDAFKGAALVDAADDVERCCEGRDWPPPRPG